MTILLQGAGLQTTVVTPSDPIGDALRAVTVAYWKFDEADSVTRVDATGRGNDLPIIGTGQLLGIPGVVGNCIDIVSPGDDAWLGRASTADLQLVNNQSFYGFGWVSIGSLNLYALRGVFGKYLDENYDYSLEISNTNQLGFYYGNGGVSVPLATSDFVFVEFYYDHANKLTGICLNQTNEQTSPYDATTYSPTTTPVEVGNPHGVFFHIKLDELGIIKQAGIPTAVQRDYLYNSGAGRALFPAP